MIRKKGVEDNNNHILSIDLHPRSDGTFNDVILNGVEVFKLSKPDGNLARSSSEMVPSLPAASTAKESKTEKTTLIAIGSGVSFLVVLTSMCCVLLLKLRKAKHYGSKLLITVHYRSTQKSQQEQRAWKCWKTCYHFMLLPLTFTLDPCWKRIVVLG